MRRRKRDSGDSLPPHYTVCSFIWCRHCRRPMAKTRVSHFHTPPFLSSPLNFALASFLVCSSIYVYILLYICQWHDNYPYCANSHICTEIYILSIYNTRAFIATAYQISSHFSLWHQGMILCACNLYIIGDFFLVELSHSIKIDLIHMCVYIT